MLHNESLHVTMVKRRSCSPDMSAITSSFSLLEKATPTGSGRDPPGSGTGTLFDRITGFSNEKAKLSGGGRRSSNSTEKSDSYSCSPIDFAKTPPRGRLETTVLSVDNVVHSPKRDSFSVPNISFLDCAITPIKREKSRSSPATANNKRLERSKTFSLTSSEGESREHSTLGDEWREVTDPISGKTYYYNRLTRVSKWKLPKGAVLRQKRSTKNNSCVTAVTDESSLSHLQSGLRQGSEREAVEVSSSSPQMSDYSSPERSDQSSSPHSENAANGVTTTTSDNIKSPQDTTMTAGQIFCLYCGLKCRSLSMLESHLPQCSCFIRMQDPGFLSTQMEVERVLFSLWSKTASSEQVSNASNSKVLLHSPIKETIDQTWTAQGLFQSPFKESRGNDDTNTFSSPKFNVRERNNIIDFCIEKKTCPFCEEALVGGDQFSSHLLKCKERKKRRNRRRTPKKHPVVEEFSPRMRAGVKTPGRRMPWETN